MNGSDARSGAWPAGAFKTAAAVFALVLCAASAAAQREIVFIAPANHAMPLAQFDGNELKAGLLKDLGEAIAARIGRRARFLTVPGKRVPLALTNGDGDGVCYVQPYWIDGDFDWTRPFIPNAAIIAGRDDAPPIHAIADLADMPVGTVLGYRHPAIDAVLGEHFRRDDAPDMEHNLRKLAVGRVHYAVTEDMSLAWYLRNHHSAGLRTELVFENFQAQCAFSHKSRVPFGDVERAIDSLINDGSVAAMLARYR